ncbi:MBL fold metallo-hydrolase [Fulvivirga sp. RKSG066]|nr:MBL fold metallo-hydrolase [Fulvivirga aurantia]
MIILGLIAVIVVTGILFVNLSPEFGGDVSDAKKEIYAQSRQYEDGKFTNEVETKMGLSFKETVKVMFQFFKGAPNREPKQPLPMVTLDSLSIANRPDSLTTLTWFGHSTFLLEVDGLNVLIDPMFGATPAPHPMLGPKRFNKELPLAVDKLPSIDAVIFSHDHYDHLDYGSVVRIKDKVQNFYVPLGLGAHLEAWGVSSEKIHELDWWETINHKSLTLTSTPARHFSGRAINDRFATLWCSWVIKSATTSIFFSGDSGYGPHFKEIGEKYGPFDFAMMECGQYDERWRDIHMLPEETAVAGVDLGAEVVMPIHWGAFRLAMHSWDDPIKRVTEKAESLGLNLATPKIGETIQIKSGNYPQQQWWKELY